MALGVTIPSALAITAAKRLNDIETRRTQRTPESASNYYGLLDDTAEARIRQFNPGAPDLITARQENVPPADSTYAQRRANSNDYGSHAVATLPDGREVQAIKINPNSDAAIYAHELGHAISNTTKPGKFVRRTRDYMSTNPALSGAIGQALMYTVPGLAAALQEGDDDLLGSIALAAGLASPTLIDEALATKNALAIMDTAGMRATLGQRGRLAAGYMTYLAPVLLAGSVGNFGGNLIDDKTALYDL